MSEETQRQHYYVEPTYESIQHNHAFITIADVARDHQHGILGTTGPAIYSGHSHSHRICVLTTSDPKGGPIHWHVVDVVTGPAIEVAGDEHTHQFCGETSCVLGHAHSFNSTTDTAPDKKKCDCDHKDCDHDHKDCDHDHKDCDHDHKDCKREDD
ncbi:hypothetical protein SPSIL_018410 [Sporomusa silvacetica DSM 10669]|uniref:YmaF family protein n=1 Tax=Sporomusa silvacetica DSM 10669 TaxID=1123289 RepID=A0ABZ3IJ60_9FIRM|nr:YmaF family protein [Sporomusa silvacetica]OZC18900.1 YmaF family protein [Sporomusa silvacetica DSM 10669]